MVGKHKALEVEQHPNSSRALSTKWFANTNTCIWVSWLHCDGRV